MTAIIGRRNGSGHSAPPWAQSCRASIAFEFSKPGLCHGGLWGLEKNSFDPLPLLSA
jgi:hypothetical protein